MKATKFLILICLISYSFNGWTQEICDNGIDDDGDGLVDLNDVEDCECDLVFGDENLLPNGSFEDNSCCELRFTCIDSWEYANLGSPDYYNYDCLSYFMEVFPPPLPLPDGDGFIGLAMFSEITESFGICLDEPLLAGETYIFSCFITRHRFAGGDVDMTIYGSPDCDDLPIGPATCPEGYFEWEENR